ncbi:hypothetical protein [Luteibacter aegosomatissinici]|uniref:hypothetical protein n=1 Tax=Luteibacter aegosomatissinici TaxID=2911539 RepID=UPI001FFA1B9C|nr:hypothetical protein [Luteibacter aegosomatissinici]UPG93876.1 hypothetical protein L2Y97_18880 [Luteibacter aegosomatissinici]
MIRALAAVVFLGGSLAAFGQGAFTAGGDDQAIVVNQGQPSPWLRAEVRQGEATQGGSTHMYTYLHLQKPINFSASSQKDNFSQNAYHVYDLSFSSNDAQLASHLKAMIGKTVSVQGLVTASPTGKSPTELHIAVTALQL